MGSGAAIGCGEKYDAARVRPVSATIAIACSALLLAACGSEGVSVSEDASSQEAEGAEIFATHCAGCHTISAAGTQGSGNRALRAQGPNFDQRLETYDDVLFAIRNGGFSGAIMPQNIVTGDQADAVAAFVSAYAGSDIEEQPRPTPAAGDEVETGQDTAQPDDVEQGTGSAGSGESSAQGTGEAGSGSGGSGSDGN
jgi:mono/diheme cytochrome c family protein